MKTKISYLALLFIMIVSCARLPQKVLAQRTYVSFSVFYNQLSAYGEWVDNPDYGYVWYPNVGPNFEPYFSNGHWMFTNVGWMWISNYPWGWATFHYGRWEYDPDYGWFWIPDTVWGPAWVVWVRSGGYYGWAPMGPGITIRIGFGFNYYRRHRHWIFIRDRYMDRRDLYRYRVRRADNDRLLRDSRVIDHTYFDRNRNATYVFGPRRDDVQRATGRRINPVRIENNDRPGHEIRDRRIRIYRPEVRRRDERGREITPPRVVRQKDVRRPSERGDRNRRQDEQRQQREDRSRQRQDRAEPQKKTEKQRPQRKDRSKSGKDKKDRKDNRDRDGRGNVLIISHK